MTTTTEEQIAEMDREVRKLDREVRELFVTLIEFVAKAKATHEAKNGALDAIDKLQATMLP